MFVVLQVEPHAADDVGAQMDTDEVYRAELGLVAVITALVDTYGIQAGRLEAHGVGPLVPVFSNASDAGRDRNRRVELVERPG